MHKQLIGLLSAAMIAGVCVTPVSAASPSSYILTAVSALRHEVASDMSEALSGLDGVVSEAKALLETAAGYRLEEDEAAAGLSSAVDAAEALAQTPDPTSGDGLAETVLAMYSMSDTGVQAGELTVRLRAGMDALQEAMYQDAMQDLTGLLGSGRTLLENSAGDVLDEGTREALRKAISSGQSALDNRAEMAALRESEGAVSRTMSEVKASADAKAAEIWYVTYYDAYGTAEAAADGSCTQWADDYYIAHSWSPSGKRILSRPTWVVIDGVTYQYAGEQVLSQSAKFDEALKSFVYANGGIGFQTCLSGTGNILVLHYEPVA